MHIILDINIITGDLRYTKHNIYIVCYTLMSYGLRIRTRKYNH